MKKIKLFLITLLCLVGVMNVAAQDELDLTVNRTNGDISTRGNTWVSTAVYGESGGHLTVDDDAVLDGSWVGLIRAVEYTSEGYLKFNLKRQNNITISVPEGYGITGYDLTVECSMASVTCGLETKTSGDLHADAGGNQSVTFQINPVGDYGVTDFGSVVLSNFIVYFKKESQSGDNFKDADEVEDVVSGAMYVLSTEPSKNNDKYFRVNGTGVTAGGWPSLSISGISNSALVDVSSVWEVTLLNDKKLTMKSMLTDKYLGDALTNSAVVTKDNKAEAMQFMYAGPYENGNRILGKTNCFYTLQCQNHSAKDYLSYATSGDNALTMVDKVSVNVDWNTRSNQRFRFHRVDYVRIGVFTQEDGVLSPLDYTVSMIVDRRTKDNQDLSGKTPIGLEYYGQTAICSEHHQENGILTEKIQGRIQGIDVESTPEIEGVEPMYIVNGSVVSSIDYNKIKSGYNISIIYVLPGTAPDPDEPSVTTVANFYKLQTNVNGNYLTAVQNSEGTVELIIEENGNNDAIFYHDGSRLLSYTNGVYVKDNIMDEIGEPGSNILLVKSPDANIDNADKWDVRIGYSQYLTCDNGGGTKPMFAVKPSGEYDLIPVTELPVKLNIVGGHRYGTFYAPVDVTVPEGLEAYVVEGLTKGDAIDVMSLVKVTEIPANTGVILYEETTTANEYALTITSDLEEANSILEGVCPRRKVKDNETLYGLNKKTINGKETAGFYKMKTGSALSPFRAFLDYSEQGESKGFAFSFTVEDAIEAIEMSHAEDAMYDLQGRRVQNAGTGIYIVNGKKIMVRK